MNNAQIPRRWTLLAIVPTWGLVSVGFSLAYDDWSIFHDWIQFSLITAGAVALLICAKKVSPFLIRLSGRFLARYWRIVSIVTLLLILFRLAMPCPLRGNYAGSFTAHGCEDRAFLRFADRQITYFHDGSQPEYQGRYERVGWNTYVWRYGVNDAYESTITVGWFFIQIYGGAYWLHRDLSLASDQMVKRVTTNTPYKSVQASTDNALCLSINSLTRGIHSSALVHENR